MEPARHCAGARVVVEIAETVGSGWIATFPGELAPAALRTGLDALQSQERGGPVRRSIPTIPRLYHAPRLRRCGTRWRGEGRRGTFTSRF